MSDRITIKFTEEEGDLFAQVLLPPPVVEFYKMLAATDPGKITPEARETLTRFGYGDLFKVDSQS